MRNGDDKLDESSIVAVSSLRSRFEQLTSQPAIARPTLLKTSSSIDTRTVVPPTVPPKSFTQSSQRPRSVIEPLPERLTNSAINSSPTRSSFEDRSVRNTHNGMQEQTKPQGQQKAQETSRNIVSDTVSGAKPSAKPHVPYKKPGLTTKVEDRPTESPFDSSTEDVVEEMLPAKAFPALSSSTRPRNDSDASWVERLRADSDASTPSIEVLSMPQGRRSPKRLNRPSRVDSNASWVEASDLTDPSPAASLSARHGSLPQIEPMKARIEAPRLPPRPPAEHSPTIISNTLSTSPEHTFDSLDRSRSSIDTARSLSLSAPTHFTEHRPIQKPSPALPQRPYSNMSSAASSTTSLNAPPAPPAPRRSLDRRRELTNERSFSISNTNLQPLTKASTVSAAATNGSSGDKSHETSNHSFPDISSYNRRPPKWRQRPSQINTELETRLMAVSSDYVCATGYTTRVWDIRTGALLVHLPHPEGIKGTAIRFVSRPNAQDPNFWLGTSMGELQAIDVDARCAVDVSNRAHTRREIVRIFENNHDLWSLDESGNLALWRGDKQHQPNLQSQFQLFRAQRGHTASIVCDSRLWLATGKEIEVYDLTAHSNDHFVVSRVSLTQLNVGDVTSMTTMQNQPDLLYTGHTDGKISVFGRQDMTCKTTMHASLNKIGTLYGIGPHLWAGYGSGHIQAYDTTTTPWRTKKEWQAHSKTVTGIAMNAAAAESYRVVTLGADNVLKIWDGLFEEDWLDERVQQHDASYCTFQELTVSVLSWNAGATKPSHLQNRIDDDSFLRDYLAANSSSDILVFGFQELVDLEDKKLTAKSIFKSKKKDAYEQEHMSHQYRAWQDHLMTRVREYGTSEYINLHTASMIGLFTCVFVKSSLRRRIKHMHHAEVKRGMGGLYGNKGALILRMVIDDSSICFVNCHLAAGQTHTASRNDDAAAILSAECLPAYPLDRTAQVEHADVFPTGGDGTTVLDHELCIWNGDLNYRIDTMSRDTVVKFVEQGNLTRLLERDQLLLSRKKNPGFKLRAFQEKQIEFAPTYKYNVNSNEYDTSEKRRSPAWCDRVLYRGLGKIKCESYRRWEVRVSDHRPVSALLTCRVKTVDQARRAKVLQQCTAGFQAYRRQWEKLLL